MFEPTLQDSNSGVTFSVTARVGAADFVAAAIFLEKNGYLPRTRSDVVASALNVLGGMLAEAERPTASTALKVIDEVYPTKTKTKVSLRKIRQDSINEAVKKIAQHPFPQGKDDSPEREEFRKMLERAASGNLFGEKDSPLCGESEGEGEDNE